jgi:hypothetical protein
MKRALASFMFVFAVCIGVSLHAANKSAKPDFAYPQKVAATAGNDLKVALKKGDDKATVDALLRYGLAKNLISADSLPGVLSKIEQVSNASKSPVTRTLLNVMQAQIYVDLYQEDAYNIRERSNLAANVGDDYTVWSYANYVAKVKSLLQCVTDNCDLLLKEPLANYSKLVTNATSPFYPTLYDFAAYNAINCLNNLCGRSTVLNAALLHNPFDTTLIPQNRIEGDILRLYMSLYDGREETLPGVMAWSEAIDFIYGHSYLESSSDASDVNDEQNVRLEAYRRWNNREYAIELLIPMCAYDVSFERFAELYAAVSDYLKQYPNYFRNESVSNWKARYEEPFVKASAPKLVCLGDSLTVTLDVTNTNKVTLSVYDLSANFADGSKLSDAYRLRSNQTPIQTIELDVDGEIPFQCTKAVKLMLPGYGAYAMVASFDGAKSAQSVNVVTVCSDMVMGNLKASEEQLYVVVDPRTGAPVSDVAIKYVRDNKLPGTSIGETDANGFFMATKKQYGKAIVEKGDDRYLWSSYYGVTSPMADNRSLFGEIFPDLSLYHFGDSVNFGVVVYQRILNKGYQRPMLMPQQRVKVVLRDANYQVVDTLTATTDEWGRFTDSFRLPTSGLSGYFTITATVDNATVARKSIEVSDYKLPKFEVRVLGVTPPAKPGDSAVITGEAKTYTGFSLTDAQVSLQLKVANGRRYETSDVFYESGVDIATDGTFSLTIPGDVMATSPIPMGQYVAEIMVTSSDGETHSATTMYALSKPLMISPSGIPSVINADDVSGVTLDLVDQNNRQQSDVDIRYTVYRLKRNLFDVTETDNRQVVEQTKVLDGSCKSDSVKSLFASLPSGEYRIEFATADSSLADAVTKNVVVYRNTDTESAMTKLVWVGDTHIYADTSRKAVIHYGAAVDDTHVLMVAVNDCNRIVEKRWLNARKGMNTVEITLPDSVAELCVTFNAMKNMIADEDDVNVRSYESCQAIEIHTTTFRDKVSPGSEESLSFKVTGKNGALLKSAVMLNMANKAIDQLRKNVMNLFIPSYAVFNHWSGTQVGVNRATFYGKGIGMVSNNSLLTNPIYSMYDEAHWKWGSVGTRAYSRGRKLSARALATTAGYNVSDEDAIICEDEGASVALYGATSVELSSVMVKSESDDAADELVELVEDMPTATQNEHEFRVSEVPLAFFMPMLETDEEGNLTVNYTVPNANTAWILRALAYNTALQSATAEVEIISSKPVMVSTNTPRFVRCGDEVALKASVMNATDRDVEAVVVSEIYNPFTNEVLKQCSDTVSIAANGSGVVSIDYAVSNDLQGVTYRVWATVDKYTDGEQSLMPILPSEQNVIESQLFYIPADQQQYTMTLQPVENGRQYLNFTENPTWEVVSALPSIEDNGLKSSTNAVARLFAAAVAEGLMKSNPDIAMTLRRWIENPADSVLTSRLQKNTELKQILLSSTPWVSVSLNETERMQRLAQMLNSRNVADAMAQAISDLGDTFVSGGGWCWVKQYPDASEWCTWQVLGVLGELNSLGWLPTNSRLDSMISASVKWYDAIVAKQFAKYPKADYRLYTYIRGLFPNVKQSTAASRASKSAVQSIIANWKEDNVAFKALDALILNANSYHATARTVLESLREHATVTPEKGMWWQELDGYCAFSLNKVGIMSMVLDAFNAVEPGCSDIDKIRQWLILNKTNNNWGNSVITAEVVSSILNSGSKVAASADATAIRINDQLLQADKVEYATGAFTQLISPMVTEPSTLTIDRQCNYPSVGGVVTMQVVPMDSIRSVGCSELSIEKHVSVYNGSEWVNRSHFSVGDKVKISLVLKADTDLQYVVLTDQRAAGLEPVNQLPTAMWSDGLCFYRETRDAETNIFVNRMPRGTYILEYETYATVAGEFSSGVATVQSQYNPNVVAHSAGMHITIE